MNWFRHMLDCAVLAGVLICASPLSAQSVQQSGGVTPTHFSCWTTNGIVQDCGVAAAPFASTGGVQPGPWCVNSGPQTGPYQSFCLNASTSLGGVLSIQNFGGAPVGGISFNINGSPAGIPAVVLPTVSGDAACFNNTTGTLIDCGATVQPSIDVFLNIGSSNSVGQGTSAQSPTPPATALMYCYNTGIQPLTDPICSAVDNNVFRVSTGSLWPAFAISYARPVLIVMTAVSGSTQATACDFGVPGQGAWQATTAGSNYALSLTAINNAMTAIRAAGFAPVFRGIIQNELGTNDAARIDQGGCVLSDYTTAFAQMAANYRAATIDGKVYPHMPIYMALTSTNTNPALPEFPGYAAVRNAQQNIVATDGNTLLPYTNLPSFGGRGLLQTNSVHPIQSGYNEWGYAMGGAILPYIPGTPAIQYISQQTSVAPPLPPFNGTSLMIEGANTFFPSIVIDSYGAGVAPVFLARSAAGTGATPTAIQSGSNVGIFAVRGYGATGYGSTNIGSILFQARQNYTDSAQGTSFSVFLAPNGSVTPALSFFVDQDKTVQMPAYGVGISHFDSSGKITSSVVALSDLSTQAANTVVGNGTSGVAVPTALSVPSCSGATSALTWTSGTGFGCNTIAVGGNPGGSNTQVQYNNSSSFGGISGVTSNGTNITIASGDLILSGSGSGSSTLNAPATGGGTATLFPGTDTILGVASTATLTNKTFDTAGTGNSFKINGTAITAVTGTGSAVLAISPTISGLTVTGSFTATGLVTNADLANSSVTYGTTAVALGSSSTSIAGLTALNLTSASTATIDWNSDTYIGRASAANIRHGQADAASPIAQTLSVQNVVTGTSNTAGVDWTFAASQGTGTGAGGNIKFRVSPAGTTGSSVNALADVMQIYNTKFVNIGGNFAPDAPLTVNGNTGVTSIAAQTGSLVHLISADATLGIFAFDTFGAANTSFGLFQGRLSGGTRASPTASPAASLIFEMQGQVYDAVTTGNFFTAADVAILTINQASNTDHSGQIKFRTVAASATTITQRMLVQSGVTIGTGSTDPGAGQLAVTAMTQTSAAQSGTVCYSTTIGALTYDATLGCLASLEELKNIHGPITGALAKVIALRPFWFTPKDRPEGSDLAEQPGFGAHQVEAVDKRLVGYGQDGKLRGVRYMEMSALLAAAIQELKHDNDNLRAEVETLKRKSR